MAREKLHQPRFSEQNDVRENDFAELNVDKERRERRLREERRHRRNLEVQYDGGAKGGKLGKKRRRPRRFTEDD